MRPDLTRIVDAFQNDIVQFTSKLIQTRSLPGQEQAVAELVQTTMEQLGYDHVWRDGGGNVIGRMGGQSSDSSLMLNCHMDCVDTGDESKWRPISYGDVLTVLPFGNTIVDVNLKGADVVAALENGLSQVATSVRW